MAILMSKIYPIIFFFSIALTILAVVMIVIFGLNFGVDFRGGSLMEISFQSKPEAHVVQKNILESGIKSSVSPSEENSLIIKTEQLSEEEHQRILASLQSDFGQIEEKRFDSIGPVIGKELKEKSLTAIIIVLACIIVYIAIVFRKLARVLSPWAMGLSATAALVHDIIIPMGVFAILGRLYNVEITAVFVAAVLTILGYSVSDTVVVFDRVRENIIRGKTREEFGKTVHLSIMQTLSRSLSTTFTTLLSLVAIYVFGGETVKYFALALIIGIFLGAYSSIFIASPILVWWTKKR
ncbi:MAG: protein-export membrane protein SecF [Candidatus Yanofskybacteria bacterium RIFCSPLOWO2_12_FULL_44_13b]|uniref:Protein-export membrane protein SecF n=2 Tax=Parcubacteria group TaxID=1794811 RepID=A0A1F8H276_9BACT|nr:MAG: protein-export membrane protein SecF [Candidatus Yanofskybacteria bacterium RIFCSPHIGHO2_01_FULL_44_110b]OGN14162.1 MAG: protein-export membrane protein SecF [Candidatus Yanofskybacteria bacterium RIFCSPHIGHO2_02_FULL_44_36b]OGN19234.1 MAG: protein-export membrane protein SecF [Candidatus Yanofskybacteria bacterium RIFCSPHIGHO2_12_FULL_44_29b]OGN25822.1 MAG: protein-export membrane protein SecF [Candidatus Yanofskybacteria bacterium RIFCSPLOWO2_01_FULL_44_88]OGN31028.1 MAG: protein-expo